MQALGGLAEACIGGGMTLGSSGIAAPLGWPVMMHGLDQFISGLNTAFSGKHRDTLTSQLLQTTGMSVQTAGMIDSGFSIVGSMGGIAAIRAYQLAAFPNFQLPVNDQILFGQKSVNAYFSEIGSFKSKPISEVAQGLKMERFPLNHSQ